MEKSGAMKTNKTSRIPTKVEEIGCSKDHTISGQPTRNGKLSRTVGAKELKENLPPNKRNQELSSTGSMLLPRTRKPFSNSMGYLEMKRVNQELGSEVQTLRNSESEHHDTISQLSGEIMEQKKLHAEFKKEIVRYQEYLATKNRELEALQCSLEEIKFENERLAAVLEGARLDAVTGVRIEGTSFTHGHKAELDLEDQHKEVDDFITSLESTISLLQDQESCIELSLVTR